MKCENIVNKEGTELTTKEGVKLVKHTLEVGDVIIPVFNNVKSKDYPYINKKGVECVGTNYSIKCLAKDAKGNKITHNGENEIFVELTGGQAKTLTKHVEEGVEINQEMYTAYNYTNEHGLQVGLGNKIFKKNKTFEEFEIMEEAVEQANEVKETLSE